MTSDRRLAPSAFPGDDGRAREATRAALAAATDGSVDSYLTAVAALCGDRLLVPVVATATRLAAGPASHDLAVDQPTVDKPTGDKEAEMSVVLWQGADGRRAGLAFTGLDALQTWRSDARPVPVTLDVLARTTRAEGATALIVDVDGPYALVVEGEVLDNLAAGRRLVAMAGGGFGWLSTGG